jgi:hypothetical protein
VAKGLHKHAAEEAGQLRTQSRTNAGYSGAKVALQLSAASSAKRPDYVNVHHQKYRTYLMANHQRLSKEEG